MQPGPGRGHDRAPGPGAAQVVRGQDRAQDQLGRPADQVEQANCTVVTHSQVQEVKRPSRRADHAPATGDRAPARAGARACAAAGSRSKASAVRLTA